jgi:hypothetical protein
LQDDKAKAVDGARQGAETRFDTHGMGAVAVLLMLWLRTVCERLPVGVLGIPLQLLQPVRIRLEFRNGAKPRHGLVASSANQQQGGPLATPPPNPKPAAAARGRTNQRPRPTHVPGPKLLLYGPLQPSAEY